eukprot:SAG31_NODE_29506_length_394_cov_0.857627_1_plen_38_part_10
MPQAGLPRHGPAPGQFGAGLSVTKFWQSGLEQHAAAHS